MIVEIIMDEGFDYFTIFSFFVWGHGQVCPLASQSGDGVQCALIFLGGALLCSASPIYKLTLGVVVEVVEGRARELGQLAGPGGVYAGPPVEVLGAIGHV